VAKGATDAGSARDSVVDPARSADTEGFFDSYELREPNDAGGTVVTR